MMLSLSDGALRAAWSLVCASILSLGCDVAPAQTGAAKPVRLVVGFPPGGANDMSARILAPKLADALGSPVIVENRPGANGIVGAQYVSKSAPDGHTLALAGLSPLVLSTFTYAKIPYDTLNDFSALTTISMSPEVFAVHPSVPARNLKELIALAKARPGALNFATTGTGGMTRMALELFKLSAKVNVQHVDYKGAAPGLTDLLGGYVHGMVVDFPVLYPHIKQGKLRGVVVTSERRSLLLPDLPTAAEQGLPQLFAINWFGVIAAPRTPRPVVDRLHAALVKVAASPDVKERFIAMGSETMTSPTPEAFSRFLRDELERWGKIAKAAGIQAE